MLYIGLYATGYIITWYEGIMAFPLGMMWCAQKQKLIIFGDKESGFNFTSYNFLVFVCVM